MSDINCTTRTEGQKEDIKTIKWTIPNFTELLKNDGTREFCTKKCKDPTVEDASDLKFQLKMQFRGRYKDLIEVYYLCPTPVLMKSELLVENEYDDFLYGMDYDPQENIDVPIHIKEYHTVQANRWQYMATIFKRDIINTYILSDSCLYLKFQFMIKDKKVDCIEVPEVQLSNDLENLLNQGLFSDVIVKSVDNIEYKVHKGLLASRSAVFKAHFEHNTTECITNVVECHLESEVLCQLLTFIYCDKAPRIDEMPERLLAAADYYNLNRLKSLCEEALQKKLTVENAIEMLQLAELHSANTLKQLTLEFIKDGQSRLITETESWAKLKSFEIIKGIYEYIIADKIWFN